MKYAALLRGIMPMNPNMRNEKLVGVFTKLGFKNAQAIISSGNIIFESSSKNSKAIEAKLEKAWPTNLGFKSMTIVVSQDELEKLVAKNPFKNVEHGKSSYLTVTFFKSPPKKKYKFPFQPPGKDYKLVGMFDRGVCSVTNISGTTPDLMVWLEKEFGKDITTRTWKTIGRILKKFNN